MKDKPEKMPFNEYIDYLNSFNSQYTTNGNTYPNMSYSKMKKNEFKQLIYANTERKLMNILMKMFKWKTPDTIDARQIELGYIIRGAMCLYSGDVGTFCLPCIATNKYNIYGNPVQVRVYGWNGYNEVVDIKYRADIPDNLDNIQVEKTKFKGIYGRDNPMTYPYINYVREYAYKLADKIIALHIATQRIKNPFYFIVNDVNLKDTVNKMVEKIESNDDIIIRVSNKNLKSIDDSIKLISNTMHPEILQQIKDAINFDFNMFLETIGINTNPSPDKTQVVLRSEIESNDNLIQIEQDVRLELREQFCKDAKDLMGVELSVENNNKMQEEIEKTKKELTNGLNNGTETTE